MVHVGMHAAVGKESEEMEATASAARVLHRSEKYGVGEELAILDHQFDTRAVHVDDTAGADIEMSHFTVAHLPVGQAHIFPTGMDKRVGIFAEQAIVGRLLRHRDRVGFRLGSVTPAVKNNENQWFGTGHSGGYWLSGFAGDFGEAFLFNSSSFTIFCIRSIIASICFCMRP